MQGIFEKLFSKINNFELCVNSSALGDGFLNEKASQPKLRGLFILLITANLT
jgi:hypothetical protein